MPSVTPPSAPVPTARPLFQRDAFLWFAAGSCACFLAFYHLSSTLVDGTFLPSDPDAFYHAHRILGALDHPFHVLQFDPQIHAPEGSWITWPWAYDTIMACIGHLAVYDFGVHQPLSVLAFVAPLWTFVEAAMLLGIANRLELSPPLKALALLCYACSPLTQTLHRVGMLGHHFVEFSLVLATLLLGLAWFQDLRQWRRATALGAVLGMAPAFHNGDFILQLPVLLALALRWACGRPGAAGATGAFAAALLLSTLLFLLPSEPFRRFMFSFALQSWFHLYIAACSGILAVLLSRLPRSGKSALLLILVATGLALAIVPQIVRGGGFLNGSLAGLGAMGEVEGIFGHLRRGDWGFVNSMYSGLIWLMPAALVALCWQLRAGGADTHLFFAVMALFGAGLMMLQFRLEYFGSFALYLPLCLVLESARRHWPPRASLLTAAAAATVTVAYLPTWTALTEKIPPGAYAPYAMYRDIFPAMTQACARAPGVMLADPNDGHFITFHTRCGVIADPFIITAQHEQKYIEAVTLMNAPLEQVIARAPYVRYIYVRRDPFHPRCASGCPDNAGLRQALLFDAPPYPPELRLIDEITFRGRAQARLFEIVRPGAGG